MRLSGGESDGRFISFKSWHSNQVGAASRALAREPLLCASLKSNMGHLEAAAAAAGLSSLIVGPLLAGVIAANAQLRRWVYETP